MALGEATVTNLGGQPSAPIFAARLQFAGDSTYIQANGTADFDEYVAEAVGKPSVNIIEVIPGDCGVYIPQYDHANGVLHIRDMSSAGARAGDGDYNGTTMNLTVLYQ